MRIALQEPPKQKRRLRVKNKKRFAIFLLVLLVLFILLIQRIYQPAKEILLDRFMALRANLDYWLK